MRWSTAPPDGRSEPPSGLQAPADGKPSVIPNALPVFSEMCFRGLFATCSKQVNAVTPSPVLKSVWHDRRCRDRGRMRRGKGQRRYFLRRHGNSQRRAKFFCVSSALVGLSSPRAFSSGVLLVDSNEPKTIKAQKLNSQGREERRNSSAQHKTAVPTQAEKQSGPAGLLRRADGGLRFSSC
ncbi:hypothetical protein GN956_G3698 [Arapaima gigas]